MLIEHRNDEMRTALVFVNSFDFQKEEIEDYMEENRIYAEVFEIDRMRPGERVEYLNCLHEMYGSRQLPAIFVKDKFVGTFENLRHQDYNLLFD
jgi:glutaredoxin